MTLLQWSNHRQVSTYLTQTFMQYDPGRTYFYKGKAVRDGVSADQMLQAPEFVNTFILEF